MANRNSYTYTPGYTNTRGASQGRQPQQQARTAARPQGQRQAAPPAPRRQTQQPPPARPSKDLVMFAVTLFVLPLVGIIGVFARPFLWAFVVLALLCVAALWVFRCFAQGTRTVFSIGIGVISIMALLIVVDVTPKTDNYPLIDPALAAGPSTQNIGNTDLGTTPDGLEGMQLGGEQDDTLGGSPDLTPTYEPLAGGVAAEETEAPPVNPVASEAQAALENYMRAWQAKDYEAMATYALPSWRNAQQQPSMQLYWTHDWWILNSWTIQSEAMSPTADSATFTLITDAAKNNSARTTVKYKYLATVINESGSWYVDPESVRTGMEVDESLPSAYSQSAGDPTAEPEPTIPPNMQLWYNSDGGSYYHTQEKCSSIAERNHKHMKAFAYSELGNDTYKKLEPCSVCSAPERP